VELHPQKPSGAPLDQGPERPTVSSDDPELPIRLLLVRTRGAADDGSHPPAKGQEAARRFGSRRLRRVRLGGGGRTRRGDELRTCQVANWAPGPGGSRIHEPSTGGFLLMRTTHLGPISREDREQGPIYPVEGDPDLAQMDLAPGGPSTAGRRKKRRAPRENRPAPGTSTARGRFGRGRRSGRSPSRAEWRRPSRPAIPARLWIPSLRGVADGGSRIRQAGQPAGRQDLTLGALRRPHLRSRWARAAGEPRDSERGGKRSISRQSTWRPLSGSGSTGSPPPVTGRRPGSDA